MSTQSDPVRRSSGRSRSESRVQGDGLSERLMQLRRSRGGHAAEFTKKLREFGVSCETGRARETIDKFETLKEAYAKMTEKDSEYMRLAPSSERADFSRERYDADLARAKSQLADLIESGPGGRASALLLSQHVRPEDSISQQGSQASRGSSTSSAVARAAAKRAALLAKTNAIVREQELEFQRLRLQHEIAAVRHGADIAAAQAEEETLMKHISGASHSGSANDNVCNKDVKNVNALFQGGQLPSVFDPLQFQADTHPETVGGSDPVAAGGYVSQLNPLAAEWKAPGHNVQVAGDVTYQQRLVDMISLPKVSLMEFDGNPLRFHIFMNSFDNSVGRAMVDDGVKLTRLLEYCKGKARRLIEPCVFYEPSEGYRRARELLFSRFGNDYKIAEAHVAEVTKGSQLKAEDPVSLEEFRDKVGNCVETLKGMNKLDEVDTRSRMKEIVYRLPLHLQRKWRSKAHGHLTTYGHYPNIDMLLIWLTDISDEMNDPVFGVSQAPVSGSDKNARGRAPRSRNSGVSYGVTAETPGTKSDTVSNNSSGSKVASSGSKYVSDPKCYQCNGAHKLTRCQEFKKLSSDSKLKFAREKGLCFGCLESKHYAGQCRKVQTCGIDGCTTKHSRLLHEAFLRRRTENGTSSSYNEQLTKFKDSNRETTPKAQSCASGSACTSVALPIVSVKVKCKGQDGFVVVNALLDPGSNKTFCSHGLLSKLGISGEATTLDLETLSSGGQTHAQVVTLEVTSATTRGNKSVILPSVYGLEHFPDLTSSIVGNSEKLKWRHLEDLEVPQEVGVSLLIGQDVPRALVPLEVRHGSEGEPYAVRTVLGWSICGPVGMSESDNAVSYFISSAPHCDEKLTEAVEKFWKLDVCPGYSDVPQLSCEDKRVVKLWDETTQLGDNGHYMMKIPFKNENPSLPDNKNMALKRLASLGRRLDRDPDLHKRYCAEVSKLLDKGYAEPVSDSEELTPGMVWYLPHHPVMNPNKPGKTRIVFDCAAQYSGTSLNKSVSQGPDLTNKLIGVLLRFREEPIAMMSDIEGMFLQIGVVSRAQECFKVSLVAKWEH